MKIYLEQDSWHKIFKSYASDEFKAKVIAKNIEIYFGLETIYEFGRLCISDTQKETIKAFFSYLYELTEIMRYLKEPHELIIADLEYAMYGGKLLPFLDAHNTASAKQEIFKISQGNYEEAKKFISKREGNIEKDSPKFCKTVKSINPKLKKSIKFEQFRDDWQMRRKLLDAKYYNRTQYLSDDKLFSNYSKYPYVNTWINEQLYINFTTLARSAKPKNYTSDFRHLICANAAGNLVAIDKQLINISKNVCPFRNILHWDRFQKIIS